MDESSLLLYTKSANRKLYSKGGVVHEVLINTRESAIPTAVERYIIKTGSKSHLLGNGELTNKIAANVKGSVGTLIDD